MKPQTFELVRYTDISGVSGTDLLPGEVAHILATGRHTHHHPPAVATA